MKAITFIVTEDQADGGYVAHAHWPDGNRDIQTEADNHDELLRNIREAIDASFDENSMIPTVLWRPRIGRR